MFNSHGTSVPSVGEMSNDAISELRSLILPFRNFTHQDLYEILGNGWFGFDKFTYVGPYEDPFASWPHAAQHLIDWLNHLVVPEVLRRNTARTRRAMPDLTQVDRITLLQSLWVLECEDDDTLTQGTAFYIHDIGLVTCDHVLGVNTYAFKPESFHNRYRVETIIRNSTIDLAILKVDASVEKGLCMGSADQVEQLDHIVAAGFPYYRYGDSGLITPGVVTGFRTVVGFRHLLTNAPLIAGNSGGPVIDKNNRLIGIVVTGADRMENAQQTEKHGIIPIDALNYLRASL